MHVDILIAGDFRFPGGTSTSIASEARALAAAGYRLGLLSLATGPLSKWRSIHPEIRALADSGTARFVPQGEHVAAELVLLHHPAAFAVLPVVPPKVTGRITLLIAHHPVVDAAGTVQYDTDTVHALVTALFGPTIWAPVGPKVRRTLERLPSPPPLTADDWVNVIDAKEWTEPRQGRLPRARPVIGRHSRPEPDKWPDDRETFLAAYPAAPDVSVRLLGYSNALDQVVGPRPENWEVYPFGSMPVRDFLRSLDYFSYFHGTAWTEAFGRSVLEAMATGLVCLLPPDFQDLFGDAAIYCAPTEVLGHVRRLEKDPKGRAELSSRAIKMVSQRYGPAKAVARVAAMIGAPSSRPASATVNDGGAGARILYLTSNGIGMGHLARCLASARRLSSSVVPVVVTMSKAFAVVRDEGIAVDYLPYHRALDIKPGVWAAKLEAELTEILNYHCPDVFVFDGNVPYDGMLSALRAKPQIWRVWQRRPLWRPDVGADNLTRTDAFDVVIEPGELAAPVDRGLTVPLSASAVLVPPIRFLDHDEALSRQTARTLLGLDPDRPAVLLQLGSGNNFDLDAASQMVFDLAAPSGPRPDLQVIFARWRISEAHQKLPAYVRVLDTFPIARHLAAFDFAVAAAGYNTFHENIAAALPTLFVANDHPEQDEQWLRAEYAALRGLALSARASDVHAIRRELDALLLWSTRARLAAACTAARPQNGAEATAWFLEGLALTRKASTLPFRPLPTEATG
ncbi:hypothetical protein [Tabrizicola sp.]|uniref:hypothetical protein n=1 Tax=Tabrizicola sp. TaxID=2005166 RepID=UPI003F3F14FD